MSDLGFLTAYAVVEVLGYDPDAVVQPEVDVHPLYRSKPVTTFWVEEDAETEARRLNRALAPRPIHYTVKKTWVEIRPGDPQFDDVKRGAVYITRVDDQDMDSGQRRYQCHWEYGGPVVVFTSGFDSIDEALQWARQRADSVTVQLHGSEHYEAGTAASELPRWPPSGWTEG